MIVLREQSADLVPATSSAQNFDRRKRPLTHGMIWGIPTNAPDALWKASTNNLIVIAVSHSDASLGVFAGDRIIVDRNQQNQDVEGTYVFLDKHKLSFTNGDIIGRVIAKIVRV